MTQPRTLSRRTRLAVALASVVVSLASIVVAAGPAQAATPCQTRTHSLNSRPHTGMTLYAPGGFWQWGPYWVSDCRAAVRYDPLGYRLNRNGTVQVRIRTHNSRHHTLEVGSWITTHGMGPVVAVAGWPIVKPGTEFKLDMRIINAPQYVYDDLGSWWPLGQLQF